MSKKFHSVHSFYVFFKAHTPTADLTLNPLSSIFSQSCITTLHLSAIVLEFTIVSFPPNVVCPVFVCFVSLWTLRLHCALCFLRGVRTEVLITMNWFAEHNAGALTKYISYALKRRTKEWDSINSLQEGFRGCCVTSVLHQ